MPSHSTSTEPPASKQARITTYNVHRCLGVDGKLSPKRIPRINQRIASGLGRVRVVERSDRVFASPRLVRFSEMEYAIPREAAREAIERLQAMIEERGFRVNFPVEVRFVAPDDILLSPSHGRQTCYIAVHLYRGMDYEPYFRAVEDIMRSYGGRPHWGKLHFRERDDLRDAYPQWEGFASVRAKLDPEGRFRNPYLDRVLGPPA
jgi:L-gulono-1,4-lactone dehydrogenase